MIKETGAQSSASVVNFHREIYDLITKRFGSALKNNEPQNANSLESFLSINADKTHELSQPLFNFYVDYLFRCVLPNYINTKVHEAVLRQNNNLHMATINTLQ